MNAHAKVTRLRGIVDAMGFAGDCSAKASAFSLLELLVVVAIIGMVSVFAVMGFRDMATSHGVGAAAADVSSILELARNEAVTRQTYVWAVFREAASNGISETQMALAGSKDGSSDASGTNLVPLSRVVRAKNVGLVRFAELQETTRNLAGTNAALVGEVLGNSNGITYTNLPGAAFAGTSVTFTPRGEALLLGSPGVADGFDPLIGLGIVSLRGGRKETNGRDEVGVVVEGASGMTRQLRIQ